MKMSNQLELLQGKSVTIFTERPDPYIGILSIAHEDFVTIANGPWVYHIVTSKIIAIYDPPDPETHTQ